MKLETTERPDSLKRILQALANRLSPRENWQAKVLGPITTAAAGVEFTVTHGLGVVPTNYIWNVDKAAVIYDSRRANWTDTEMYLKDSVGGSALYLIVL